MLMEHSQVEFLNNVCKHLSCLHSSLQSLLRTNDCNYLYRNNFITFSVLETNNKNVFKNKSSIVV